jgi:hypothetical protein
LIVSTRRERDYQTFQTALRGNSFGVGAGSHFKIRGIVFAINKPRATCLASNAFSNRDLTGARSLTIGCRSPTDLINHFSVGIFQNNRVVIGQAIVAFNIRREKTSWIGN